jgi:hypothetical protein
MQTSKIISGPSGGVTRKRRGVWNGYWLYWTLIILNYNLLWRCRQFKQYTVHKKSTGSSHSLSLHQSTGSCFKRGTFSSWSPELSPRHNHTNTLFVSNEPRIILYCTASASFSRKHHFPEHALPWKSGPPPRNGSPWGTHVCGHRPSCHSIYSLKSTACDARWCMAEYWGGFLMQRLDNAPNVTN